jgi:hypothetical protein
MWQNDLIHKEFMRCSKEHINNDDIRHRLYREGLRYKDFEKELESIILPVYNAAHESGFEGNWEYIEK